MTISWYSISISPQIGGGAIFNGYFSVDNNTNLVTSFYETIGGSTNFNNNILIPTGTGTPTGNYLGFTIYNTQWANYDNAYLSNWLQFDKYGVMINSMSSYPQYSQFNLCANNLGDETINNIGIVGNDMIIITSLFTITPISDPSCFKEGTKILTDKGYQLIENLKKGDLVKTLNHGYLPIEIIGKATIYNSGDKERHPNKLYSLSKQKYPELIEDLIITGGHSILVDDLTTEQKETILNNYGNFYITDNKYRLEANLDIKAEPYQEEGNFTIYHLALENENYFENYGIYANGLLVESCSKRYLKELSSMELIE